MFTELVKLVPVLDKLSLEAMFKTLGKRFGDVAKTFGRGITNVMKLSAIGVAARAFQILMNPLEKAEEILEKLTEKSGSAQDSAEELGTDPGKLLRLQTLGEAKGVSAEQMRTLLGKFQAELAKEQVKAPGEEKGVLRDFVKETDTVDAFFKFVQSLSKMQDKSQQVVIQGDIFGEKLRGKTSQFFNMPTEEIESLLARIPSVADFSEAVKRGDQIGDVKDITDALRNANDFIKKSTIATEGMVKDIDASKQRDLDRENDNLKEFDKLKTASIATQELTAKFDKFVTEFMKEVAPRLVDGVGILEDWFKDAMPYLQSLQKMVTESITGIITGIKDLSASVNRGIEAFKGSSLNRLFKGWGN